MYHIFRNFHKALRRARRSALLACFAVGSFALAGTAHASDDFDHWFEPRTLRVDLVMAGDSARQSIYLDELSQLPYWAGRRERLDSLYLAGNGRITLRDEASGRVIYRHSFSTLFQEWHPIPRYRHRSGLH